jgi:hypothetical protein
VLANLIPSLFLERKKKLCRRTGGGKKKLEADHYQEKIQEKIMNYITKKAGKSTIY